MELDLGMDVVEGDWENGPTVDDIISSVMKTESKFGKKKLSLPNISRPSRKPIAVPEVGTVEESRISEIHHVSAHGIFQNNEPIKARTEEIKSLMHPYNGQFGVANTESLSDTSNNSSIRKIEEKENTSPQLSFYLAENKEIGQASTKSDLSDGSKAAQEHDARRASRELLSQLTTTSTATSNMHQISLAVNSNDVPSGSNYCAKSTPTQPTTMNSDAIKRKNTSEHEAKEQTLMTSSNNMKTTTFKKLNQVDSTKPHTATNLETMDRISVNNCDYLKLSLLGKGGSSKVYEVLDLETMMLKAIKVVDIEGIDDATLNGYRNEIGILERLTWSDRVVRLYDYEQTPKTLKIIMERGNKDLSSILSNARGKKAALSPFTVQHYWHGMLLACQAIHKEGIVHSDLKPANFLLVSEMVKLIDFGIASSIQEDMTSVIKDSQSGTFNYMSPESLNDVHHGPIINGRAGDKPIIKIGVKSDVWSLGCILYNLIYGRTPFQHITNPIQKLAAISDYRTEISFPDILDKKLLDVVKRCLQFDSRKRPSIEELLSHPYLSSGPPTEKESPPKSDVLSNTQRDAMQKLAALSPSSLMKITSMMQNMKDSHKTDD